MSKHFGYFLGICPGLDLPRGEEVASTMEIADLDLYPRLYLMPQTVANVRGIDRAPGPGGEDEIVWMGFEIDAYGLPQQLGYVNPAVTLRGLGTPYPTALVGALVYRNDVPQEVYIFATQTPYLTHA
jgi:hypothetical protein